MVFNLLRKKEADWSDMGEFKYEEEWRVVQPVVDEKGDRSTQQEQNDNKICLLFQDEQWEKGE